MLYFNANDFFYKTPAGATEEKTPINFRIKVSRRDGVRDAYMMFGEDKKNAEKIKMEYEDFSEGFDFYTVALPPLSVGIYWYTFIAEYGDCSAVYGRGKDGNAEKNNVSAFQLTVYKKGWTAADKFAGKIIYQIFPDRFYKVGKNTLPERKKYVKFKNENELPNYKREENGDLDASDFFGGNIKGIEAKLDYIKSLGAEVVYLNPVFEAHSNHRYDTADYMNIDPVFGTEEQFVSLCKTAEKKGIKIILDGVFSHTGDDSVYFNKYGTFNSIGAYQSESSPYYPWYSFGNFPDDYASWWGIKILPEVNETNREYLDFITGKGGVAEKWLKLGASGWRLDVADELPDGFLNKFYERVKETNPDAYVVGEVWEDATNKEGFGQRRRYLQGGQMDGVMNYVLKDAVIKYLLSENSAAVSEAMELLSENYPKPSLNCLMNILGSHDTKRILSVLGGYAADDNDFEGQAKERLSPEARKKAVKLLKIGYFLLTTLPGCPTIYYGDEAGTEGLRDPLNRKYFDWNNIDSELFSHFSLMGKIRKENPELRLADYRTLYSENGVLVFSRGKLTVAVNCKNKEEEFMLGFDAEDIINGKNIAEGKNKMPPYSFLLLKRKEISYEKVGQRNNGQK